MHQQGFQGIADPGSAGFAIQQQGQGLIQIGAGIHIQMAHALVMFDHRHPGVFGDKADQAFATTWDGQINDIGKLQQFHHGFPGQIGNQGQGRCRNPGLSQSHL